MLLLLHSDTLSWGGLRNKLHLVEASGSSSWVLINQPRGVIKTWHSSWHWSASGTSVCVHVLQCLFCFMIFDNPWQRALSDQSDALLHLIYWQRSLQCVDIFTRFSLWNQAISDLRRSNGRNRRWACVSLSKSSCEDVYLLVALSWKG